MVSQGGSQTPPTDKAGQSGSRPQGPSCSSDFGKASPTSAWGRRTPHHTPCVLGRSARGLALRGVGWGKQHFVEKRGHRLPAGLMNLAQARGRREKAAKPFLQTKHLPHHGGQRRWQSKTHSRTCFSALLPTLLRAGPPVPTTSRIQTWLPPATVACPCPRGRP